MARERSPQRDKAFEIWKQSSGTTLYPIIQDPLII